MAEITAQMIKDLRERTGAGMADCKKSLTETAGDMEKAIEYLRKKGIASAAKKATRIASEGMIAHYLHGTRIGVLVEVNCETDFVARNPDFVTFAKEVCLLDQVWVKDPEGKKDIRSLLTDLIAKTGENVRVRRFFRYEVGEGLEKRADDFAAEVKKQAGQA